jgi:hypothetical protein
LNGFMIAMTSFMSPPVRGVRQESSARTVPNRKKWLNFRMRRVESPAQRDW